MSVTFNMIIDELKRAGLGCASSVECPSRSIAEVRIHHRSTVLDDECLYVCSLAAMKRLSADKRPANFVCVSEQPLSDSEMDSIAMHQDGSAAAASASSPRDARKNIAIVHTGKTAQEVHYLLTRFFVKIYAWDLSLQRAVLKGEGIEHILELSTSVLKNHICVSDSSLRLVCVTKGNTPEDDPVVMSLLKNGYHTSDVIGDFRRTNRLDRWEHSSGQILVNTDRDLTPYDTVTRIFKYNRRSFLYVVMTCNVAPLSDGLLDLFQNLVDVLSFAAEREWNKSETSFKPSAIFLSDALAEQQDEDRLAARAKALHLSLQGRWVIAILKNVQPEYYSVDRLITELAHVLNEEGIQYQNNCIIIWKALPSCSGGVSEGFEHALRQIAEDYDTKCGISSVFSTLGEIYCAVEQANAAADCPADLNVNFRLSNANVHDGGNGDGSERDADTAEPASGLASGSCCFDDCLRRCMEAALMPNASLYLSSTYGQKLVALSNEKGKSHFDDIRILYAFLACERNAAETGRRLFMHRNTVLYRVGAVKKLIGCNLESPNERYCIMQLCQLILSRQADS